MASAVPITNNECASRPPHIGPAALAGSVIGRFDWATDDRQSRKLGSKDRTSRPILPSLLLPTLAPTPLSSRLCLCCVSSKQLLALRTIPCLWQRRLEPHAGQVKLPGSKTRGNWKRQRIEWSVRRRSRPSSATGRGSPIGNDTLHYRIQSSKARNEERGQLSQ